MPSRTNASAGFVAETKKDGGGLQMLRGEFEAIVLKAVQHGCQSLILGLAQMLSV